MNSLKLNRAIFCKAFITILLLINSTKIFSQDANRSASIDFLTEENTYYPFGKKLNFKVDFKHFEKKALITNDFEFEYKKRKIALSLLIIDSVLYAVDKNKLVEIGNKSIDTETIVFDNYTTESKWIKNLKDPYFEVILKKNEEKFLKDIETIKLWISLVSEDLIFITVYDNKSKLLYGGGM